MANATAWIEALLRQLNAEAEAADSVASGLRPRASRCGWPLEGLIGYPESHVELIDSGIETEPVVARQLASGHTGASSPRTRRVTREKRLSLANSAGERWVE